MTTPPRHRITTDGRELEELLAGVAGRMLGITGAPGAGKSTLAEHLVARAPAAALVPMDGFHLTDAELARRGLLHRKGAPDTFDAEGYAALLARIAARAQAVVSAPAFDRSAEQTVADAIAVRAEVTLVVTEGNYLLLDEPRWRRVRATLDTVWHVTVEPGLREQRLRVRHQAFGKSADGARRWVERVDAPNADAVEAASGAADLVLDLTAWRPGGATTSEAS